MIVGKLKEVCPGRLIYEDDEHWALFAAVDDDTLNRIYDNPGILKDTDFIVKSLIMDGNNVVIYTVSCENNRRKVKAYIRSLSERFEKVVWVHRDYKKVFTYSKNHLEVRHGN